MLPPDQIAFEVRVETNIGQVYKLLQKYLQAYKDEKRGPTLLALQIYDDALKLQNSIPAIGEFPHAQIHVTVCFYKILYYNILKV